MGNSNTTFPVTQCAGMVTYRVTLTEDGLFAPPAYPPIQPGLGRRDR